MLFVTVSKGKEMRRTLTLNGSSNTWCDGIAVCTWKRPYQPQNKAATFPLRFARRAQSPRRHRSKTRSKIWYNNAQKFACQRRGRSVKCRKFIGGGGGITDRQHDLLSHNGFIPYPCALILFRSETWALRFALLRLSALDIHTRLSAGATGFVNPIGYVRKV